jgi:hypothetical protein
MLHSNPKSKLILKYSESGIQVQKTRQFLPVARTIPIAPNAVAASTRGKE